MSQILLSDLAVQQLSDMPFDIGRRILNSLDRLRTFPHSAPHLTLEGYESYRQLIIRSYRVIYDYDEAKEIVRVFCIMHARRQLPPSEFLKYQLF